MLEKPSYLAFTLLLLLIFVAGGDGQMHWEKLFDSLSYKLSSKPAPRRESAIGHDIERNRIVIFGGWQTNTDNTHGLTKYTMPVLFDDTWEFNLYTKQWRHLSFSLLRPSARYGMLYTHNKYGMYISCGRGWLDEYFNDLWIYDFREDQWRQMDQTFISIIPEPRYSVIGGIYPSYEYASEDKNNLYLAMGRSQYTMYNNMYVFTFTDLRALNGIWEMIYTDILTGPFSYSYPHARTFASSAVISPDEVLVHGGCLSGGMSGGPCPSFDSWIYSYSRNKWEKIDSSCISPRMFSSMASLVSDGFRQSAVMFSGLEKDHTILKTDAEKEQEVALYDSLAKKWVKKRVQGFYFPEKRNGHVMCTGKLNNDYGVFMFGGYGHFSDVNMADLWFLRVNISSVFDNPTLTSFNPTSHSSFSYSYFSDICSTYFSSIHLHAILMFVGWGIFINIGTLISNYIITQDEYKKRLISKIYNGLQFFGLLFVTGGMVFGFWSTNGVPHLAHLLIGVFAYVLAILQPISSYGRKHTKKFDYYIDEEEKMRAEEYKSSWCYNFLKAVHKNLGRTAILLSIINISLGVFYAVFDWYWVVIWFCYLGFFISIYLLLEARKYSINSKNEKSADERFKMGAKSEEDIYEDGYDLNLSKTGSTQQLRPMGDRESVFDLHRLESNRTIENIKMEPIRYAPNNLINKQSKNSPITPPPPYFNRNNTNNSINANTNTNSSVSNKNAISTIELASYTISTSSPITPHKSISQTALVTSSDENNVNLNDMTHSVSNYEDNTLKHSSKSSPITTPSNYTHQIVPTPRKIYQTHPQPYEVNQQSASLSRTTTFQKNDSYKETNIDSYTLENNNSFKTSNPYQTRSTQQRTILNNKNIINHINKNILNPVNNPNNYRY